MGRIDEKRVLSVGRRFLSFNAEPTPSSSSSSGRSASSSFPEAPAQSPAFNAQAPGRNSGQAPPWPAHRPGRGGGGGGAERLKAEPSHFGKELEALRPLLAAGPDVGSALNERNLLRPIKPAFRLFSPWLLCASHTI